MKYLNLVIAFLSMTTLHAQYSDKDAEVLFNYDIDFTVALDTTIDINRDHVYADYLADQNDDYIQWVYQLNERRNESIKNESAKTDLIDDRGGENSLVFTLVDDNGVRYDTLSNLVSIDISKKPEKIGFFRKLWNKIRMPNVDRILEEQNIQGSLPEGCMSWVSANKNRLKCGVEIIQPSSEVRMELINSSGVVVHIFADGTLYRGWNNYEWDREDHKKGIYTLSITVDGVCMTQDVRIK